MATVNNPGSPGSHPDYGRNWRPATTLGDYLRNIEEGLEERSDRRIAKLMGWSRQHWRRVQLTAKLPDDLFDLCLAGDMSQREMAQLAEMLIRNDPYMADTERCPHCGEVLRRRPWFTKKVRAVIRQWFADIPEGQ